MQFGPHLMLASLEGAVIAAVLALTAMGLSIVFGVMRVVNVAHGEFFMLGAVLAWFVTYAIGGHPALGFVAALVIAPLLVSVIAAAADTFILKHIKYDPDRTIVATIGLLYFFQQGTLMTFGPDARPVEAPFNHRLALPWIENGESGLQMFWPWGLSITSYKLCYCGCSRRIDGSLGTNHTDQNWPYHARHTTRQRDGTSLRYPCWARVFIGLWVRSCPCRTWRGSGCTNPTGALSNGRRTFVAGFHRSYHWWLRQLARDCCCRCLDRHE